MIKSFRGKGLSELWTKGRTKAIDARLHKRILRRLDRLDAATGPQELNLPGFDFHALKGFVRPDTPSTSTVRGASPSRSRRGTLFRSTWNSTTEEGLI